MTSASPGGPVPRLIIRLIEHRGIAVPSSPRGSRRRERARAWARRGRASACGARRTGRKRRREMVRSVYVCKKLVRVELSGEAPETRAGPTAPLSRGPLGVPCLCAPGSASAHGPIHSLDPRERSARARARRTNGRLLCDTRSLRYALPTVAPRRHGPRASQRSARQRPARAQVPQP